jgi:hypothetical protein
LGKVILVPPQFNFEIPNRTSDMTLAVSFSNSYSIYQPSSSSTYYPTPPITASVTVPATQWHYDVIDPLGDYASYFEMGFKGQNNRKSKRKKHPSVLVRSIDTLLLERMFWDHEDLEQFVEPWEGDLLLQVGKTRWSFCCTDVIDVKKLETLNTRQKNHRLITPSQLRKEIYAWLCNNAQEFDMYEVPDVRENTFDEIFIKDDAEAIHFKMKWTGVEPNEEEE